MLDLPSFQVDLLISYIMYSNGNFETSLTLKNSFYFIRTQPKNKLNF